MWLFFGLYLGGALRHFLAIWWLHTSFPLDEEDRPSRALMLRNWAWSTFSWPLLMFPQRSDIDVD